MPRSGIGCYNRDMAIDILKASHTRYSLQYHFVWIVKYRKDLLRDQDKQKGFRGVMEGIGQRYWFPIESLGTDGDHVHCFLRAAPRYSPAQIMNIVKSISAKEMFKMFPELRKLLWGGEFWGDGYYVGSVGDGMTVEIIKKYIENQGREVGHKPFEQLVLF